MALLKLESPQSNDLQRQYSWNRTAVTSGNNQPALMGEGQCIHRVKTDCVCSMHLRHHNPGTIEDEQKGRALQGLAMANGSKARGNKNLNNKGLRGCCT